MRIKYLIKYSSTLQSLSNQRLKETNIDLYKNRNLSFKLKVIENFTSRNSYKVIVPIVFALSLFTLINFDFYNISFLDNLHFLEIDKSLITTLIDNRINNIVTITSISLVVVGFLINSIKEKNKETYSLLFEETKLYPIVYYILSVITMLLIVSFLRDTIASYWLTNLFILGMWLIIIVIICIGFLFSKIIQFSDSQYLYSLFSKNLIRSTMLVIYREKMMIISKTILSERLNKYGAIISSSFGGRHPNPINIITDSQVMVKNIDIDGLEGCLKNLYPTDISPHLDFYPISLFENLYPNTNRTFISASNAVFQHNSLAKVVNEYIQLIPFKDSINMEDIKTSLIDKALDAIDKNDIKTLEQIMANYDTIYDLYTSNF